MKSLFKKITILSIACAATSLFALSAQAADTTYQNMFMSYFSPVDVSAMVDYAKAQKLGGLILWEMKGDAPYDSANSLLAAANKEYGTIDPSNPPQIMGYWTEWSVYNQKAIPSPAYPIPGSEDTSKHIVNNTDFVGKLAGVNVLAYAFLEAEGKTYSYTDSNGQSHTVPNPNYATTGGTLFFYDPWADLLPLGQDDFCSTTSNQTCWYVDDMQHKNPNSAAMMGNFEAFANLHHSSGNPLGPLKRVISVGGYSHDATFEDAFDSKVHMNNFVNSAVAIIKHYNLDGIDLDYEDPNMTYEQSDEFYNLVDTLRSALGPDKIIDVTILSNPAYINGTEGNDVGFDPHTDILYEIAQVATHINLMTYDFHGAFDYDPGKGRTGFLTNIYKPSDIPAGYDAKFSVDAAVQAVTKQGIKSEEVTVGVPAYGRALTGIPSINNGLFQVIPSSATIPRGNLDDPNCATAITPLQGNSCSGSFTYNYIVSQMLGNGFTATAHNDDAAKTANGTTAYAGSWTVKQAAGHTLKINNTGGASSLGIEVTLKDSANHSLYTGYVGPGNNQQFNGTTNPSTTDISDQTLSVHWDTYKNGPNGNCSAPLAFTKDTQISISVDNQGHGTCSYQALN